MNIWHVKACGILLKQDLGEIYSFKNINRKEERLRLSYLSFHLQELEKEEQVKYKERRREER